MKLITIFNCLFLLAFPSMAQNTYMKTFGGSGDEGANSVIATNDGNFLVVGYSTSYGNGGEDGLLLKIDSSGNEIWTKAIGGANHERFFDAIQLPNNDIVIAGWTESYGAGGQDVFLVKVDNNGNIIWTRTFGALNDEIATTLTETSDGNVVITGHTKSYGNGLLDVLLLKVDTNGIALWSNAYGQLGNDFVNGFGLIEDAQSNYVVAGSWSSSVGIPLHNGFIFTLDSLGNIVFSKLYGGNQNDGCNGHVREGSGTLQNIGISWSWNGSNHAIWMSEFDSSGGVNWSKTFGLPNENIRIGSVFNLDSNQYLISAYEHTNSFSQNGILLKVDSTGTILWAQTYGGSGAERLECVIESNHSIFAFGQTNTFGHGGQDILMLKTDSQGAINGCSSTINLTTTNVVPIEAFPNPNTNSISLGQNAVPVALQINIQDSTVCIHSPPIANFVATNYTICQGDCIDLINSSVNIGAWQWTFTGAQIGGSTALNPINICFPTSGAHTISLIVSNSNGVDTISKVITVLPSPQTNLGNDTTICSGQSVSLDAFTPNATYLWSDSTTNSTLVVVAGGQYSVTVTQGTCQTSDTILVTVIGPSIDLGNDTTICSGQSASLDAFTPNATYLWSDNSTNPILVVDSSGTYRVTVSVNNCMKTDSIKVSFPALPAPGILGKDSVFCGFSGLTLTASVPNASSYVWSSGETSASIFVTIPNQYSVGIDIENCEYRDSILIEEDCSDKDCAIFIPNVFSPNRDGINDVFLPESECTLSYFELRVYNRWGTEIFESHEEWLGWDGSTSFDQQVVNGVYFYLFCFELNGSSEGKVCKSGSFHLFH